MVRSAFHFVSFFKNINQLVSFSLSLILFGWPQKHSTIHMTIQVSFLTQSSIQLVITSFLRQFIQLLTPIILKAPSVRLFIYLLYACCRKRWLTFACQPQIKVTIQIESLNLPALKLFVPNTWSICKTCDKSRGALAGRKRFYKRCEEEGRLLKVAEKPHSFSEFRPRLEKARGRVVITLHNQKIQVLSLPLFSLIPYGSFRNVNKQQVVRHEWSQGVNLLNQVKSETKRSWNCHSRYKTLLCKMQSEIYLWRLAPLCADRREML